MTLSDLVYIIIKISLPLHYHRFLVKANLEVIMFLYWPLINNYLIFDLYQHKERAFIRMLDDFIQ